MLCYSNNGMSMRAVDDTYAAQQGEVLFADYATHEQLAATFPLYETESGREAIKNQIADLELTVTRRRIREAALSDEGRAWLQSVDDQISSLREQL